MRAMIGKEFTFDSAHQLVNHNGKCARLHGHTYKVVVFLSGDVHPIDGTSSEGMVVDFDRVTQTFTRLVKDPCDHRFLVQALNPDVEISNTKNGSVSIYLGRDVYTLDPSHVALLPIQNTTAECLASWMLKVLCMELDEVEAVRVYETPTSFAEAEIGGDDEL